ncbi:MAG: choice-of-anchor L domain-containing protein [Bacteroidetes bacterium]|nr:choice-of-anchor L domain-containing protein [Bacteroidota bacterium]
MKKVIICLFLACLTMPGFSQLTTNGTLTPTQLVNNVLLGSGVTATNITYTGAAASKASFNCAGACNIGVPNGILLSSGSTAGAMAPAAVHNSTDMGTAGDAQLDAIVTPRLTEDASVLEFDFSVASDSVKFEYVFASEEYNDYANTNFNDVFAFFISGPGIVGSQNIAIIPGTTTPVSINTVNNGNSGGVATGPCMNCQYFVDNVGGGSVYFDGFTTVLTAKARVQPCETYHIKLAIADAGDGVFDSGVFLKGGSFSSIGTVSIYANGNPQVNASDVYACTGTSVNLCLNPASNYTWSTGETTQCITVTEATITASGNYGAFVTGTGGCFAYTEVQVHFVTPSATITPSGPTALCPGGNVTLTANPGNSYLWSNGATTQSINVTTAGNYVVTVTAAPNCSATSTPVAVTVGSATAQITGVLSLCNGANTTLTANAAQSYLWSNGAVTQNLNVTTAGNYTVTVTQAGGCTATATVNVVVNTNPVPAITGTLSFCAGANTTLNAGAGFNTYLWNTGAVTQNLTALAAGTYTVTVTNAAGCTGIDNAVVVMNPLPVPNITGTTSFCAGGNSNLNGGAGFSSYLWNTGAVTQQLNVTTAGNYTVTVTNAAGCSANTSVNVTVNALPVPNITGLASFCQGANSTIDAGAGYASYQWNTGAVTQTINVSAANTYTVTVTNANGCSNTDSQVITVNPLPVPAISGTTTICQGANTSLTAGPGFTGYLWSTGGLGASINVTTSGTYTVTVTDGNGCKASTSTNVTVNPLPAPAITGTLAFCSGNNSNLNAGGGFSSYLWNTGASTQVLNVTTAGNYVVTVTNGFGCSASTNAIVTVNALPVPNITGVPAFCQGSSTTLNAGGGYASYLWSNGANTQNITVTGQNTYTVTVTNNNGCSNTDSQVVTVNANPVPSITGNTVVCQGISTSFNAGAGYSSYQWSNGASIATINPATAGTYTVTVTDANGCTGTTAATLTVNPLPTPAITGVTSFCQGLNSNLNAGPGYGSYLWNTGATSQLLNVDTSGNYTVTVTNGFGCTASTNTAVVVDHLPVPVINCPQALCIGSSGTLNAGAGYASYLWNNGSVTQTINVSSAGNYAVTVTSNAGCTGTTSSTMVINPLPTPAITGVTTICQGTTTILDAGAGYNNYLWSNGATGQTLTLGVAGPVTVTVTDANGCIAPASTSINVNALPTPAITGVAAFCQGGNSTLDAGIGYSSYLWSTGATSRTINVTTAGNYAVTVSAATGCTGSDNQLITVNPNPSPAITGGTGICQGTSTTLTVPGTYASYQWNTGETSQNIQVANAGNYTVTVTTAFGCTGTNSTVMVVNPLPTPVITGVTSVCQGTATIFDAGAGYSSYQWSNGGVTQTINPGIAGTFTVTVTDANGCINSDAINLTVNPLPVPAITGTTGFCQGANSNLDAGNGFASYLWSNGSSTQVINVSTSGNYVVTVTDNNGCSANTSTAITVYPNPSPAITGITGICQGSTTTLTVPGTYASYQWNTGATTQNIQVGTAGNYAVTVTTAFGCTGTNSTNTIINALPNPVITGVTAVCQGLASTFDAGAGYSAYLWSNGAVTQTINPSVAGTFTVTVTDANGCQNNTSLALNVYALPQPVINGDFEFCIGDNSTITAGVGYASYIWNTGATASSVNITTAGNYAVTVTDGNGCVGSTSATVIVNALPTPVISGLTQICDGTTTTLITGNYASYQWSNGETGSSIVTGTAGSYNVTVTDINGCVNSTSTTVTVFDLPQAVVTGTSEICIGQSTALNFNFTGTAPFTYTYSDGSTTFTPAPVAGSSASINVAPGNTMTYQLSTIADAHCAGTISGAATVTVNQLPLPVITGDLEICDGEITALAATPGYATYTWSNNANQQILQTGASGIYTVSVIDVNGCQGTSPAVNLVVNEVPVVAFTNDTSMTCAVPEINFTNLSTYIPGSVFNWNFGDGSESETENPSHIFNNPGLYHISLAIKTPAACVGSNTSNVDITFFPLPEADYVTAPGITNIFTGKISFVDRSSYAVSWLWDFGDGAYSYDQNPNHYYNEVGDYKVSLKVTNIAGCEDVTGDIVTVNPFYIPNAFTPNGDGINDNFYYSGYVLDVQNYDMKIFNRWGQLVFAGATENDTWNGYTLQGDLAPQGTYVYRLHVTTKGGKDYTFNGHVNLIR